jgi:hypothetical protein
MTRIGGAHPAGSIPGTTKLEAPPCSISLCFYFYPMIGFHPVVFCWDGAYYLLYGIMISYLGGH